MNSFIAPEDPDELELLRRIVRSYFSRDWASPGKRALAYIQLDILTGFEYTMLGSKKIDEVREDAGLHHICVSESKAKKKCDRVSSVVVEFHKWKYDENLDDLQLVLSGLNRLPSHHLRPMHWSQIDGLEVFWSRLTSVARVLSEPSR